MRDPDSPVEKPGDLPLFVAILNAKWPAQDWLPEESPVLQWTDEQREEYLTLTAPKNYARTSVITRIPWTGNGRDQSGYPDSSVYALLDTVNETDRAGREAMLLSLVALNFDAPLTAYENSVALHWAERACRSIESADGNIDDGLAMMMDDHWKQWLAAFGLRSQGMTPEASRREVGAYEIGIAMQGVLRPDQLQTLIAMGENGELLD